MGQRSQIYVRYQKDGVNYLIARYYQWNYSERMISRCRHSLGWIENMIPYDWYFTRETEKLKRILDVNFDMHDIVIGYDIIKEWEECDYKEETSFKEYVFLTQDNNDGKLFIDIKGDVIKYAFLDYDCNTNRVMSAAQYMQWDCPSWRKSEYIDDEQKILCETNIKTIKKMAKLMTKEEIEEFISADYESTPKF